MRCYYHPDREATVTCNTCGKGLCSECGGLFQPPTCRSCAEESAGNVKKEMITSIILSVILMFVGIFATGDISGILLAGIPYGWTILNRIQPSMFLWLSWVGWIIYFLVKLVIAYIIGLVALPIKIVKWIKELREAKKVLDAARR